MKLFSYRKREVHKGPYPLETLARTQIAADVSALRPLTPLQMVPDNDPLSICRAMDDYLSLLDSLRDGPKKKQLAEIPESACERAHHLKATGYFLDSAMVGICRLVPELILKAPFRHPLISQWWEKGQSVQKKVHLRLNLAAIYQRMEASKKASEQPVGNHSHAIVVLVEYPRDPRKNERGADWIQGIQLQRASLRAAETATIMALYLRNLGIQARAHTATSADVDLRKAAVAAGVAQINGDKIDNPYIGSRFGIAVVTTTLDIAVDRPLARQNIVAKIRSKGPAWWLGICSHKNAFNFRPFAARNFKDSLYPMEKVKRRDTPTTLIDEARIPRIPKRADFFIRVALGDLGKEPQACSTDGFSITKHPMGEALGASLNAYAILQRAVENKQQARGFEDPQRNSDLIKATLHFLGADMVGISRAPDWVWYSHSPDGKALVPAHNYAITALIDQGHETMEGASGDDWISAAQSMRSYVRASLVGGVVAQHLRYLGFAATNHTAADGDVLQPPLMLLSGLGEISRIGDVVLNPYLGPRLKCGVVTTDLPLAVDKPIDFGLQTFCENCNKCARECPSGAISVGKKVMFNGYEVWKPDAEKCARYRFTNDAGSMCGRCMKTCPWNLEGIFKEAPYRWLATHFPALAPLITKIDDWLGNGDINPVKKWWWDLRAESGGAAIIANDTNKRGLNTHIHLKPEEQTLACYPADLLPPPYPVPCPINREAGIEAYKALITPDQYRKKLAKQEFDYLAPKYSVADEPPPIMTVMLQQRMPVSADEKVVKFDFTSMDGSPLPAFAAGAHIDVMPVPQFIRQYSLCSDPANPSVYSIGVLREDNGRGGSVRIHRLLQRAKPVLISRPRNHFPLVQEASRSIFLAGGIGITPLMAMAYTLHQQNKDFCFYYKASTRAGAGFIDELQAVPWADRVEFYFSDENRLDVADVLDDYRPGDHLYTCGPAALMDAVFDSARRQGWSEDALHREYFSVPDDTEAYDNHAFKLILQKRGVEVEVPENMSATEALAKAGFAVDTKCTDGLCGVCATPYLRGVVEHRDFVLSKRQRKEKIILCCSRASRPDGEIVLDI